MDAHIVKATNLAYNFLSVRLVSVDFHTEAWSGQLTKPWTDVHSDDEAFVCLRLSLLVRLNGIKRHRVATLRRHTGIARPICNLISSAIDSFGRSRQLRHRCRRHARAPIQVKLYSSAAAAGN